MGGIYGDYIKSGAFSLIDLQNRIVREILEKGSNKKNLRRIIWIPPYLKIPDQRQELYLRRLKREETDENTEIIQAPLEDLKSAINKTLRNKDKIAREKLTDKKSVYIIHDYKHTTLVPEIKAQISDQGLLPITLDFAIENIVEAHFENLIRCDGVLIIYNGLEQWLNAKLNDLKKVWGYGRNKPFEIKAVLLKEDAYKDLFQRDLGDIMKLIIQEGMLQKTLQPFVNLIHAKENG